ncbi:MAG: hypothetical protein Q8M83_04495 [bacterium]|nr:hypothetical protein [bacterium]
MSGFFTFLFSIWLGYVLFLYLTHPEKKKHRVPKLRVWRIELMPNIRIHSRSKFYHIHHWAILTLVTALTLINYEGLQYLTFVTGTAIGGIVQGLRYPDRFQFRHHHNPNQNFNKELPKK